MHRGLVAVSASAVAAIYMAGYLRTQSADASIGTADVSSATSSPIAITAPAAARSAPTLQATPAPAQPRARAAQPTPIPGRTAPPPGQSTGAAQPPQGALKDGTYSGQGSSRRGDVWVTVDVQAGRIANVTISRSTLQYPLRDIAGLPAQVVQRQTAQVDTVSRATYSSQAFKAAVAQALSKAA